MTTIDTRTGGKEYLPFIDWLKAVGLLAIIYGHSPGGDSLWNPVLPFYLKQLGVVCFVFATGVSLARETRPWEIALFNRMFDVMFVGIGFSVLLTIINMKLHGTPVLSNYMPYVFGVSQFVDNFPANPSTWYVGMYFHLILFWLFFLRKVHVKFWMIALCALLEIPLRAVFMDTFGNFFAYMQLTNWLTIFLAGIWVGQSVINVRIKIGQALLIAGATLGLLLAWPAIIQPMIGEIAPAGGFPYTRIQAGGAVSTLLVTSTAITGLYLVYCFLLYQTMLRLPRSGFIQFLGRNSLFVFVVHMPLVFAFKDVFYATVPWVWLRIIISFAGYYLLLACISEVLLYRSGLLAFVRRYSEKLYFAILRMFGIGSDKAQLVNQSPPQKV